MRHFKQSDAKEVLGWLRQWGLPHEHINDFPPVGRIEPGVAVGFLVRAEAGTCFLEGYLNNPDSNKEARRKAEIEITKSLIRYAKTHGFFRIIAITDNPFIEARAQKIHGFKKVERKKYLFLEV